MDWWNREFTVMRKALFLDRDGTVNVEKNYLYKPADFEFVPGILELCRGAQSLGYDLVIATNQSGIARGYYTEEDFQTLTLYMKSQFGRHGITILDIFHCPHLQRHEDRKPEPGMFLKAASQYGIDMASSLSLGDKERDIEAGIRAGIGFNCLLSRDKTVPTRADAIVASPDELLSIIQSRQ